SAARSVHQLPDRLWRFGFGCASLGADAPDLFPGAPWPCLPNGCHRWPARVWQVPGRVPDTALPLKLELRVAPESPRVSPSRHRTSAVELFSSSLAHLRQKSASHFTVLSCVVMELSATSCWLHAGGEVLLRARRSGTKLAGSPADPVPLHR